MTSVKLKESSAQYILSAWISSLCDERLATYVPEFMREEQGFEAKGAICFQANESLSSTLIFVDIPDSGIMCLLPAAIFLVAKHVLIDFVVNRKGLFLYFRLAKIKLAIKYDIHPMVIQSYLLTIKNQKKVQPESIKTDPFLDEPVALEVNDSVATEQVAKILVGGYYSEHEEGVNESMQEDNLDLQFEDEVDFVSRKANRSNYEYKSIDDYFLASLRSG